jgi:hypothetical protein
MTVPKLQRAPDAAGPQDEREAAHHGRPAATGLTSSDAAARLTRDGGNVLPSPRPTPLWRRIATQLRDPLVLVLLAAAGFTLATADFTDAAVILLVIVVNTTVGVIQEIKGRAGHHRAVRDDCPGRRRDPRRPAKRSPRRRPRRRGPAGTGRLGDGPRTATAADVRRSTARRH